MKRVRLDDGRELEVPPESLEARPDGSFYLRHFSQPGLPARPAEEAPPVYSQGPQTHGPLFREDCEVKRVRVMRLLDQPVEPRQDGDTYIVPLTEEVLVLEKRLLLREELHITRKREERADHTPVRKEDLGLEG